MVMFARNIVTSLKHLYIKKDVDPSESWGTKEKWLKIWK